MLFKDPEVQRLVEAHQRKVRRIERLIGWTNHIPLVGRVVHTFWFGLLDEGIKATCKPRWGTMTFAYLNDGFKPSLWHTWHSMTHGNEDPLSGIYTTITCPTCGHKSLGAPRSKAEAETWLGRYEKVRDAL